MVPVDGANEADAIAAVVMNRAVKYCADTLGGARD
jgi:hypothetical protein